MGTELERLLAQYGHEPLELSPGLPEPTEGPAFTGPWAQANPYRRAIEALPRELQWLLMYPPRVFERYARQRLQQGEPLAWPPPRQDGSYAYDGGAQPFAAEQFRPSYEAIDALLKGYEPGPRESENIEDRRPQSIWQYR